ncbi:hypothetical protein Q5P01_000225 [Channa striata]|uniref:Uncharacterized protein n=1 Tax=Channa striata TaxID=64152 RepID=A0AA88LEB2_CHASR|nr:hypothetical protein Q5P01_000225 [Channa striata]
MMTEAQVSSRRSRSSRERLGSVARMATVALSQTSHQGVGPRARAHGVLTNIERPPRCEGHHSPPDYYWLARSPMQMLSLVFESLSAAMLPMVSVDILLDLLLQLCSEVPQARGEDSAAIILFGVSPEQPRVIAIALHATGLAHQSLVVLMRGSRVLRQTVHGGNLPFRHFAL